MMRLIALAIALSVVIVPLEAGQKNKVHHAKVKKNKFNKHKPHAKAN